MVFSEELRVRMLDEKAWLWKRNASRLKKVMGVSPLSALASEVLVHLESLEKDKRDDELEKCLAYLKSTYESFEIGSHKESAAAISDLLEYYSTNARARKSRRKFIFLGGAILADAVFELSGGTGVIRTLHGLLTDDDVRKIEKESRLQHLELPKSSPVFVRAEKNDEIIKYLADDLKKVLAAFDNHSKLSVDQVRAQVASYRMGKIHYDDIDNQGRVARTELQSQKLLLPMKDSTRALVISDYHSFAVAKNFASEGLYMEFNGKEVFFMRPTILAYSEDHDICIAYTTSPDKFELQMPTFSSSFRPGDSVQFCTSSMAKKKYVPLSGTVAQRNKHYILTDAKVFSGYSGAPVCLSDGRIIGIHRSSLKTAEDSPLNLGIEVNAEVIKQLIEFVLDSV